MNDTDEIERLRQRVNSLTWAHAIDLGHGIVTPGIWGKPQPLILRAFEDIDFRGKKVLDVGCWDGLWSFEAERRGAETVYATDDISQRSYNNQGTFDLAKEALASRVKYFPRLSVFDIRSLGVSDFDVVLFCGVHYHLRDPLLALARLRQVMKTSGLILIEGDVIYGSDDSYSEFFYRNAYGADESVWWVPTIPCLREWVESSYFELYKNYFPEGLPPCPAPPVPRYGKLGRLRSRLRGNPSGPAVTFKHRMAILARAVRRKDPHYIFSDPDFKEFDLNEY